MECPLFDFPNELKTFHTFPISHSENVECFQKLKTQSVENIPEREPTAALIKPVYLLANRKNTPWSIKNNVRYWH